jgi:phage head maturation protease
MNLTHKILDIKVLDHRKDGGRITITTGNPDREHDRVFPQGAKLENYLRNPVVLWGHDYYSAASLIGRTKTLEATETGIVADFDLRPAANDVDPQNIVLLLWDQEFVRASSIGFWPSSAVPNDLGGMDFVSWELLEFSLCSVPMNPDALRLAAKSYPKALEAYQKRGRVLSAANEKRIRDAHQHLGDVLEQIEADDDGKTADPLAALAKQVSDLHTKLDQLLAERQPPAPEPIDDDEQALLIHLNRISALRH